MAYCAAFDAAIAFRRTVRTHPVVDADAAELGLRVDELPDAAKLSVYFD